MHGWLKDRMISSMSQATELPTHEPTSFVIFGATGDLSQRKLLPALFRLWRQKLLPPQLTIVGVSRDSLDHATYRAFVHRVVAAALINEDLLGLEDFCQLFLYHSGQFEDGQLYLKLSEELIAQENSQFGRCTNKLFYLAVPPTAYATIFQNLAFSGLTIPCGGPDGWTRVIVEKPFGHDLATAQELDRLLGLLFKEGQIFRVDHYLAKETVQNILAFRFSNSIFEPLWNNEAIEKVEIRFWEEQGVGERGAFYEDVGALRDVGQNHLLQMLALIAMEDPDKISAGRIRRRRADVLKALRPVTEQEATQHTIRAQYDGYRQEAAVKADSNTETYFRLRAFVDNDRWRGVPFYLESGKRMSESKAEISVHFRERPNSLSQLEGNDHHQNILTFRVQPDEGISLIFWVKKPGFAATLEPRLLAFNYTDADHPHIIPDAYERVLHDCIRGDQTLFTSTEEVSASWQFITPILEYWRKTPLVTYHPGSRGLQGHEGAAV